MHQTLSEMGFTIPYSQANFLWCTRSDKRTLDIYEKLKLERILVRYMEYPDWGDGLRITVGTDPQVDALLEILPSML